LGKCCEKQEAGVKFINMLTYCSHACKFSAIKHLFTNRFCAQIAPDVYPIFDMFVLNYCALYSSLNTKKYQHKSSFGKAAAIKLMKLNPRSCGSHLTD